MKLYTLSISILIVLSSIFTIACDETEVTESSVVPSLSFVKITIDEDTPVGTKIGSVKILEEGNTPISAFTLNDTDYFEVNELGEIKTKVSFDYEYQTAYSLSVFATNKAGISESTEILIKIKKKNETEERTDLATPILGNLEISIPEEVTSNVVIGTIPTLSSGASSIRYFTLSDEQHFAVNQLGELTTKTTFDYHDQSVYHLNVFATNEEGEGLNANITVNIIDPSVKTLLCDGELLSFDFQGQQLKSWAITRDDISMATVLQWSPVVGATRYDITFSPNGEETYTLTQSATMGPVIAFEHIILQTGYEISTHPIGEYSVITSSLLRDGVEIEASIIAYQDNEVIAHFNPINFELGKEFFSETPQLSTSTDSEEGIKLEWCPVDLASSYVIKYGQSEDNLDQTISGVSPGQVSMIIADLVDQNEYFFAVAAASKNGVGNFSKVINAVSNSKGSPIDLSIDKVTFNQAVQIDLGDPTVETPVIANKSGVLRVFVNSHSHHQSLKVEVKLGGSHDGVELPSIIKEVALQHSPFEETDSASGVIHFNIDDPQWLREGTSFYVELDPNNKLTEIDESNNHYPSWASELSFYFEEKPPMRVKLFSVTTNNGNQSGIITEELVSEAETYLKSIFPLSDVEIMVGESFNSTAILSNEKSSWSPVLSELASKKNSQVSNDPSEADVFYYGVIDCAGRCGSLLGLATLNERVDMAQLTGMGRVDQLTPREFAKIMAHELGHNHGREHINSADEDEFCGQPLNIDHDYPYNSEGAAYGRIGKTGYHHIEHRLLNKEHYHDIMTYCDTKWISDYTYQGIHDFKVKLDRQVQNISKKDDEQQSKEMVEGVMFYGELYDEESGELKSKIHQQNRLSTAVPQGLINDTEFTAIVSFIDSTEMEVPLSTNMLDHSDARLFHFFIPSQEEVASIMIKDLKSGELTALE